MAVHSVATGTKPTAADAACAALLKENASDPANLFRAEILKANLNYRLSKDEPPRSTLKGGEAKHLKLYSSGAMISLGAGADIYRPLYDFPLIGEYHLVDHLMNGHDTPAELIGEIKNRLEKIDPTAVVTVADRGFLDVFTAEEMNTVVQFDQIPKFNAEVLSREGSDRPLIFTVAWQSPTLGAVEKTFYLHAIDFENTSAVQNLLDTVNGSLVAVLESELGVLPPTPVVKMLMQALGDDGVFIFEQMGYPNAKDEDLFGLGVDFFGDKYSIALSTPDPETRLEMANSDPTKLQRFYFEFLVQNLKVP